ncbi:MAG: membrane protein insertase YidC [Armatimonadetes bacterium]|nr:membrane protein insertase YidC [Armatimonadota bacterium]
MNHLNPFTTYSGAFRRAVGLALAVLVMALLASGCAPQPPKPEEAAKALKAAQQFESQKRYEDAMRSYAQAAQLDPKGTTAPEALVKWGQMALQLEQPQQAIQAYTQLNAYRPPGASQPPPRNFLDQFFGSPERPPATVETSLGSIRIPDESKALLERAHIAQDRINSGLWTYKIMDFLVRLTGKQPAYSYWVAILIFTLVLKVALTPLTVSQLRSSRKMMLIQPKMKEIQDRYRDQPDEMNRRVMALYKEEGVNPLGCGGGMILQMAIMFMLYRVILDYQYQFHNAQFLWIGSAFATQIPHLLATNLAQPDKPLLVIYAISMYVQSKLTMMPTMDPQQQQQQKMMALMMPFMLFIFLQAFPSAFALYWLLFNVVSTVQTLHINRQLDTEMGVRSGPPNPGEIVGPAASPDGTRDDGKNGKGEAKSNVILDGQAKKSTAPPLKKGPGGGSKKNQRRK